MQYKKEDGMENQLVSQEKSVLTAAEVRGQVNLIQEIMKEVMTEGQHYGKIPGCGDKPTLLKPGAEKLSMTFRLRPIMDNDRDINIETLPNGHINVRVYCHIMSAGGLELATGIGSCSSLESKFRYRGGDKKPTGQPVPTEYWNLKKAGKMAEAKDLIGGDNFGTAKIDGIWQICEIGEKMENSDIADTYNTVLKMAKKRAYIDGILSATAASDIFTQDIEDMPEDMLKQVAQAPVSNGKPAVEMPKEKAPTPQPTEPSTSKAKNPISEPQRKRLYAIYKSAGYTDEDVKNYIMENLGIESTKDIEREAFEDVCAVFSVPKAKDE
jgi:hypothetical protein